jgi:hypothetical protein
VAKRLAAILIALLGRDAAAQTSAFEIQTIASTGRTVAAELADLDGDGRAELLSIVARGVGPDEAREIQVRNIDAAGRVSSKPSWSAPVPAGAAGYDLADLDGQPGAELLLLERDGVAVLSRRDGATSWRHLLVPMPPTAAVGPDERGLDRLRLARPELGAGRVLVPGLGEAWLLGAHGEAIARLAVGGRANYLVPTRPGPEIGESELELYFDVPTLQSGDVDGDGRADVVASSRHTIRIFLQRKDGSFPRDPDRDLPFRLMDMDDQVRNSGSVRSELFDLDRDGRADLLVSQTSGGLMRAKNHTRIHLNRGGTFDLAHPDHEYVREGGVAADQLVDLDGDGRPEWLRIFLPFGLLEMAELFVQRSVDVDVSVFRPDEHGGFEREPWITRALSFSFDFETLRPRGFAAPLTDDWNRDGYRDWLASADGKAVEVWLGGPSHRFASAQSRDPVDSSGRVSTGDLDGDGLPDFVVYDPRRTDVPLYVGRNRGNLPGSPPRVAPSGAREP